MTMITQGTRPEPQGFTPTEIDAAAQILVEAVQRSRTFEPHSAAFLLSATPKISLAGLQDRTYVDINFPAGNYPSIKAVIETTLAICARDGIEISLPDGLLDDRGSTFALGVALGEKINKLGLNASSTYFLNEELRAAYTEHVFDEVLERPRIDLTEIQQDPLGDFRRWPNGLGDSDPELSRESSQNPLLSRTNRTKIISYLDEIVGRQSATKESREHDPARDLPLVDR
jgi:hypothetical protein